MKEYEVTLYISGTWTHTGEYESEEDAYNAALKEAPECISGANSWLDALVDAGVFRVWLDDEQDPDEQVEEL